MDKRSWKFLSQKFGWKVKTRGFSICGIIPASLPSARLYVSSTQEHILSVSSSMRKTTEARGSEYEEDTEEGSLVRKSHIRRHVVSEDETHISQVPPSSSIPFSLVDEPENVSLYISDEDVGLQLEKDVLAEEKGALEQQLSMISAELAVLKASSNKVEKGKNILESYFAEQHSKATEEIRSLKELLNEKEVYASDLVQMLTQAQEDLNASTDKVQFLKSSLIQAAYEALEAEKEELKAEIEQWEKD
ncbi:interactor of constitutive active ROPs 1-like [Nicotiana tomentosiformis]|uniref:interactor of constitutive active ROPs 1-like n=1 Tax=Nicotiana tomentosiformis TaxID=4098 RepID=UPI00388C5AD5